MAQVADTLSVPYVETVGEPLGHRPEVARDEVVAPRQFVLLEAAVGRYVDHRRSVEAFALGRDPCGHGIAHDRWQRCGYQRLLQHGGDGHPGVCGGERVVEHLVGGGHLGHIIVAEAADTGGEERLRFPVVGHGGDEVAQRMPLVSVQPGTAERQRNTGRAVGDDAATGDGLRLEHHHLAARLGETPCRRQSGEAGTHHSHPGQARFGQHLRRGPLAREPCPVHRGGVPHRRRLTGEPQAGRDLLGEPLAVGRGAAHAQVRVRAAVVGVAAPL